MNYAIYTIIALFFLESFSKSLKLPLCCDVSRVYKDGECIPSSYANELDLHEIPIRESFPIGSSLNIEAYTKVPDCSGESLIEVELSLNGSAYLTPQSNSSQKILLAWKNQTKTDVDYCLSYSGVGKYRANLCPEKTNSGISKKELNFTTGFVDCIETNCIGKCCRPGESVSLVKGKISCFPIPSTSDARSLDFASDIRTYINNSRDISFVVSFPLCLLYQMSDVTIFPNGSLFIPQTLELISIGSYCVDYFFIGGVMTTSASVCSKHATIPPFEAMSDMIYPLGFITSCIFLAVTFVMHLMVPRLRDKQGLCFMSYTAALFVSFLLLSLNRRIQNRFSEQGCLALGILNHYFLMSAFFWLNVMCFDIWKVVRKSFKMIPLATLNIENKKTFFLYSLYGWGCPFVISMVTLSLQLMPDEYISETVIRPKIAVTKCWFAGDLKALFAYYNGIVAVLLFINLFFIAYLSVKFHKEGLAFTCFSSKKERSQELRIHNRQHLNMFWQRFCIFALMVINWTTEVLSFIPPKEMWILTDIINTLQGVFVFIIFVRSASKRVLIIDAWKNAITKIKASKFAVRAANRRFSSRNLTPNASFRNETPLTARFQRNNSFERDDANVTIISHDGNL